MDRLTGVRGAHPRSCVLFVSKGCVRTQASPSSPLPSTLACLTTFLSLGVEE